MQEKCDGLRSFDAGKLVKQDLDHKSVNYWSNWWLGWSQFPTSTGQQAKGHPQTVQELFREEAVTEFQPRWTSYNQKVIL